MRTLLRLLSWLLLSIAGAGCDHESPTVFDGRIDGPPRDARPADAPPDAAPPPPDAPTDS